MRAALHAHILVWMMKRTFSPEKKEKYEPLAPIPREASGSEPKQRPRTQHVPKLPVDGYQEDNCYHRAEMARIWTEMVRPSTAGPGHGGFADFEKLRVAGLARAIQTKLYLHSCSNKYCLQGRSTCRFFFPWPEQRQQLCEKVSCGVLCPPGFAPELCALHQCAHSELALHLP